MFSIALYTSCVCICSFFCLNNFARAFIFSRKFFNNLFATLPNSLPGASILFWGFMISHFCAEKKNEQCLHQSPSAVAGKCKQTIRTMQGKHLFAWRANVIGESTRWNHKCFYTIPSHLTWSTSDTSACILFHIIPTGMLVGHLRTYKNARSACWCFTGVKCSFLSRL